MRIKVLMRENSDGLYIEKQGNYIKMKKLYKKK